MFSKNIVRQAINADMKRFSAYRILQQQQELGDDFEDNDDLYNRTLSFLEEHLNKDFWIFYVKKDGKVAAFLCLQELHLMPNCSGSGVIGLLCSDYVAPQYVYTDLKAMLHEHAEKFAEECGFDYVASDLTDTHGQAVGLSDNPK